jgi:hypothetical protein
MSYARENKCLAEYIWIGGSGGDLRSKTRVLSRRPDHPDAVPLWTADGSATGLAPCEGFSTIYLKPRAIFPDSFRCGRPNPGGCPCLSTLSAPSWGGHVLRGPLHHFSVAFGWKEGRRFLFAGSLKERVWALLG